MTTSARNLRQLAIVTLLSASTCTLGRSQHTSSPQPSGIPSAADSANPLGKHEDGMPDLPTGLKERQEIARNTDRQKRLVADSDKLLQLATQLHDDVAKTDKNVLSMDVIRRADEIEKLAHSVKERMKG